MRTVAVVIGCFMSCDHKLYSETTSMIHNESGYKPSLGGGLQHKRLPRAPWNLMLPLWLAELFYWIFTRSFTGLLSLWTVLWNFACAYTEVTTGVGVAANDWSHCCRPYCYHMQSNAHLSVYVRLHRPSSTAESQKGITITISNYFCTVNAFLVQLILKYVLNTRHLQLLMCQCFVCINFMLTFIFIQRQYQDACIGWP